MQTIFRYSIVFLLLVSFSCMHAMEDGARSAKPVESRVTGGEFDEDEAKALATFYFFERHKQSIKKFSDLDAIYTKGVDEFCSEFAQQQLDIKYLKQLCEGEKKRLMEVLASIGIMSMQKIDDSSYIDVFLKQIAILPIPNQENAFALISEIENKRDMYNIVRDSMREGNAESFMQQIEIGIIDINWTFNGASLLRLACHSYSPERPLLGLVKALFKTGKFNVDEQDGLLEEAALHIASRIGSLMFVRYLLTLNPNVNLKSAVGMTPLDCAAISENEDLNSQMELIRILKKAGAVSSTPLNLDSQMSWLSDPTPQPAEKLLYTGGKDEDDGRAEEGWIMVNSGDASPFASSNVMNIVDLVTSSNNNNASHSNNNNSNNSNSNNAGIDRTERPVNNNLKRTTFAYTAHDSKTLAAPDTLSWHLRCGVESMVQEKLKEIHTLELDDLKKSVQIAQEKERFDIVIQIVDEITLRTESQNITPQSNTLKKRIGPKRLEFGE